MQNTGPSKSEVESIHRLAQERMLQSVQLESQQTAKERYRNALARGQVSEMGRRWSMPTWYILDTLFEQHWGMNAKTISSGGNVARVVRGGRYRKLSERGRTYYRYCMAGIGYYRPPPVYELENLCELVDSQSTKGQTIPHLIRSQWRRLGLAILSALFAKGRKAKASSHNGNLSSV